MKNILYHTTRKNNLESILKQGLIPSKFGIVYLSERPDSWWNSKDYITLEINIENISNRLTTFNEPKLDEILCWGHVEPTRIKIHEVK